MSQLRLLTALMCLAILTLGGCANSHPATQPSAGNELMQNDAAGGHAPSATGPSRLNADAKAHLTLDQIRPAPTLPSALRPTTDPSGPAPTSSLLLYAQAMQVVRDAQGTQLTEQQVSDARTKAIDLLNSAVAIDPYSFELFHLLGDLYASDPATMTKGIEAFESAAAIRPDDVDIQRILGRAYLAESNLPQAIWHFRLAQQTSGYHKQENEAAIVDRFLAESLEGSGYLQAAVEEYTSLRNRIRQPTEPMRYDADIGPLVADPLPVWVKIASLQEKLGQHAQAVATYKEAATTQSGDDTELARAMFEEYDRQDQVEPAAQLVVNQLAEHPQSLRELVPMIDRLVAPARRNEIQIPMLQGLSVPAGSESARQFLIAQIASIRRRDTLARSSLEASIAHDPPFAPAYRMMVNDIWNRLDWDDAKKQTETKKLADKAAAAGNKSLSLELGAMSLLNQNQTPQAVDELAKAMAATPTPAPDLQVVYAEALYATRAQAKAVEVLQNLTADHPTDQDAWQMLFNLTLKGPAPDTMPSAPAAPPDAAHREAAQNILARWLAADPGSVKGRLQQAEILDGEGQTQDAQGILMKLEGEHGDDSEVLDSLMGFCVSHNKVQAFVSLLMQRHNADPRDRRIVSLLVTILGPQQPDDAVKILNDARKTLAGDAEGLYSISPLYQQIGKNSMTVDVLQEVLKLDPKNAAANNDLGYDWADEGKNLPEAEKMIRLAVDAEPDNESYLDSMGWVLYKRGKFDQAKVFMEKAIDPSTQPDPVVLNHYGDVLYRLGDIATADKQWQRARDLLGRVDLTDPEHARLMQNLTLKLQQVQSRRPADVAPVGADMES